MFNFIFHQRQYNMCKIVFDLFLFKILVILKEEEEEKKEKKKRCGEL